MTSFTETHADWPRFDYRGWSSLLVAAVSSVVCMKDKTGPTDDGKLAVTKRMFHDPPTGPIPEPVKTVVCKRRTLTVQFLL